MGLHFDTFGWIAHVPGRKEVCPWMHSSLPSSVLGSFFPTPFAGGRFLLRMYRCGVLRGALVWRVVLVGHARVCLRWVGVSVRLVLSCSLLFFCLFLPAYIVLSYV